MSKYYIFIAISILYMNIAFSQDDTIYIHKKNSIIVQAIPATEIDSIILSTAPNTLFIHIKNNTDTIGIATSEIDSIVFYPPLPVANFKVEKYSAINTPLIFTDSSVTHGINSKWSWDFNGDGIEDATGKEPQSHTYTEVGPYTVSLTVTDEFGQSIKTDTINTYEELITDIDGNKYGTIKIGTQYWMAHNLCVTRYNNGDTIPNVTIDTQWYTQTQPAYCWISNNKQEALMNNYGALYNTYAAQANNICPSGWHVPSDDEWNELEFYLAQNYGNYDSTLYSGTNIDTARSKIAKSVAGIKGWTNSEEPGTVGNVPSLNNSSNFSGNTVGSRAANGDFNPPGNGAGWWTNDFRYAHTIYFNIKGIDHRGVWHPAIGFSIRCVKD